MAFFLDRKMTTRHRVHLVSPNST